MEFEIVSTVVMGIALVLGMVQTVSLFKKR